MKHKWLAALMIVLLFSSTAIPFQKDPIVHAESGTVEISENSVNMRSGPGLSYSVISSLKKGDTGAVLSRSGDWIHLDTRDGSGWVASWLTTAEAEQTAQKGQTAVSSVNRLNVRTQPDLNASVLTQMNAGEQADLISFNGDWAEVNFRNTQGFVSTQYISISDSNAPAQTNSESAAAASSFEIAVSGLNVRTEPDLNSKKIGTVRKAEVYPVLEMSGNWVKISLNDSESGWVYSFYGHLSSQDATAVSSDETGSVTVTSDGTNIRVDASTSSAVLARLDAGTVLQVAGSTSDWYEVRLPNGRTGYVAGWVVTDGESSEQLVEKKNVDRQRGTLNGLTIVLDPGHGGNDGGTVGVRQTAEKGLTLKTAEILSHHLRAAGANVLLTRQSDVYVDLRKRVSIGHQAGADAFISIHYDSTEDRSVSGFTSYYMHDYQEELAAYVNHGLGQKLSLRDRGTQPGNYLVLRENRQPAILVELGFLSNYAEERVVSTSHFREQAALGLYEGIIDYFDAQLD
ncbi:SH3 domain-containing protein [Planomicrobium sp. YIM 101495]|uniref:SH3 domain-containing protein n=1 Tax=Planomicrobium sp. YIM 101495 TaxID=2665160 RepID=UPI0012B80E5B|nr:SH3 domain-containing protein [Planomicrobium sp. YIM 101495]MTD29710.1 SH3 domain-containing protein [Planomicrobium sp. YIM 101495]